MHAPLGGVHLLHPQDLRRVQGCWSHPGVDGVPCFTPCLMFPSCLYMLPCTILSNGNGQSSDHCVLGTGMHSSDIGVNGL